MQEPIDLQDAMQEPIDLQDAMQEPIDLLVNVDPVASSPMDGWIPINHSSGYRRKSAVGFKVAATTIPIPEAPKLPTLLSQSSVSRVKRRPSFQKATCTEAELRFSS